MSQPAPATPKPSPADWAARAFFFALMFLLTISVPHPAGVDLDPSWRMAMAKFFRDGLQFGPEVAFTYGPLGFLLANTDDGVVAPFLLAWQVVQALIVTTLVFGIGLRLQGYARYFYFVFFFLLGVNYHDATQQMIIAFAGFALLRNPDAPSRRDMALAGLFFAVLALIKFTNLVLVVTFVLCLCGLQLWRRHPQRAAWMAGWFLAAFLGGWMLCGQHLFNLPTYLHHSWEISQGYQEAMGVPTPPDALWKGLTVLALVILYAFVFLFALPDRARALATVVALGGYTYMNWKHGFVRADGHMIGFFFAMLLPATAFPLLLGDGFRLFRLQRGILIAVGGMAVFGITDALPGFLQAIAGYNQDRALTSARAVLSPTRFLAGYQHRFEQLGQAHNLERTRALIGHASVDVLGHEQGVAIVNGFNYRPRPVLQGYSVYRPLLARLNFNHYASDRAPDYVLAKFQTIDNRLLTLDDSELLQLLAHRYEFVHIEKGFNVWRRKSGPFDPAALTPEPAKSGEVRLGEMLSAGDLADEPLWATVDLKLNLLGRLRSFFYKPPMVQLHIRDRKGNSTTYRMPLPQGRTGFIINPVVEDAISYMRFASRSPERMLESLGVSVAPQDADCFAPAATITLHRIPRSLAGEDFFRANVRELFPMFKAVPVSFEAQASLSQGSIDGNPVMVLHAPSEMVFNVPEGAKEFSGAYGFIEGAYNGGQTDGAVFAVTWHVDQEEIRLHERNLEPLRNAGDRGLQSFTIKLPPRKGGYLRLQILPGPRQNHSWDWTAWTGLEFR